MTTLTLGDIAEFRGPGVRHRYDDSGDDFELDMDQRNRGFGGRGRIILLGDGTEVLTDGADDHEIVDEDEDKDLDSQAGRGTASTDERSKREGTPGPEPIHKTECGEKPADSTSEKSTITEEPKSTLKPAVDEPLKKEPEGTEKGTA